jgi:hypothetical protein
MTIESNSSVCLRQQTGVSVYVRECSARLIVYNLRNARVILTRVTEKCMDDALRGFVGGSISVVD